ncbi:isopropylmalate isomerase [Ruegeria arenilitoris]|uniref:isopropylmalate isomerase n=1 Tax=Ruegeria arenilitoris TaxID=1173585 RepID=UPI00147A4CB1|nr:isopropylmalate isomerase [Ruegeria arenilitoris]
MSVTDNLGACIADDWSPVIGDPSVLGWVTVAAYGLTAVLCLVASPRHPEGTVRVFWATLGIVLFALMINKQLDLQSALTAGGRCLSQMQGWYEERRAVQFIFIVAIVLTGFNIAIFSLWALRQHLRAVGLALIGLIILICFILIRAAGFHHFDEFLNTEIQSIRMNWILELTSIALIAINAIVIIRRGHLYTGPKY